MRKADLQSVCARITGDVDGALGCALVHLETGLPLAFSVASESRFGSAAIELLCAVGATCFGGAEDGEAVQELQATTADAFQFMALVPGRVDGLLVLVIDREATNLGLGWMAMRRALAAAGEAGSQ
ncbi:MAG: hypothetical protein OXG82_05560 [Gammaproteobacteria bacterium]|nr:hypothetical protein [Gammaproteobacteria bacterium]